MTTPDIDLTDEPTRAAQWAARLDAGPLSAVEEREFQAWLGASPAHAVELQEHAALFAQSAEIVPALVNSGRWPRDTTEHPVHVLRWGVGLAAAAAIALAAVWWTGRPENFATPSAQRRTIELTDGSHVHLNARTALAVKLRSAERRVTLPEGEAYFEVAKDKARPFFVATPVGQVRVTGTAFNVLSTEQGAEITVAEGSVEVTPLNGATVTLRYGEQATISERHAAVRAVNADALADRLAWREGMVVFGAEPLTDGIAKFARYHGRKIDVDASVAQLELGGRFRLDDLDRFLRDLVDALPVRVVNGNGTDLRIVAR